MARMSNNEIIDRAVFQAFGENPEALQLEYHTFEAWKARGYIVRRGEHAVLTVKLWKHSKKTSKSDQASGADTEEITEGFYLAKAFLFSSAQVDTLKK